MSDVGQRELFTQNKVIAFFQNELGYQYLGDWKYRAGNSNVHEDRLRDWLRSQGHRDKIIGKVLYELGKAKAVGGTQTLYDANRAEESEKVSAFDDMSLVELIVERGEAALDQLPKGLKDNKESMAETIENNVRKVIIDEMAVNPKYYEKMSELLDELIKARKTQALKYKAYLAKVVELTKQVKKPETHSAYPTAINSPGLRSLYDNLTDIAATVVREASEPYNGISPRDRTAQLALDVDRAVRYVKKAGWRGNKFKEKEIRIAIKSVLGEDDALVDAIFEIMKEPKNGY